MWKEDNDKILDLLDKLNDKNVCFPLICPVCGSHDGHIYMYGKTNNLGSAWVWCGNCMNFSHFTYKIPYWWQNLNEINEDLLTHSPSYLNRFAKDIDIHVANLLKHQK